MRRAVLAMLVLTSCGGPEDASAPSTERPTASSASSSSDLPAAGPKAGANPIPADSAEAAAAVVQRYYAALDRRRYAEAYALWDPASVGMDEQAFARSFDKYASYHAEVGAPGRVDTGAGQRYVTVPVRVFGTLKAGGRFAMDGPLTLHRTADIDGSTSEQRTWRIRSSGIRPRPEVDETDIPRQVVTRYRCIDGSRLAVSFDTAADTAAVSRGGQAIGTLAGQRPASGIWYARDGIALRGKGRDATFSEPGRPPLACTQIVSAR